MQRYLIFTIVMILGSLYVPKGAVAQAKLPKSPYVLRIIAGDCSHEPKVRQQTGFRLKYVEGIVTALHGVADCSSIVAVADVDFVSTPVLKDLRVRKVDIPNDTATLSSYTGNEFNDTSIGLEPSDGTFFGHKLQVLGYPEGLVNQIPKDVSIPGDAPLRELIPPAYISVDFENRGSPNLDNRVFLAEAHLLRGHSGAPILTNDNKVVGIANGGWDDGRKEVGWAIKLSSLNLVDVAKVGKQFELLRQKDPQLALAFSTTSWSSNTQSQVVNIVSRETFQRYEYQAIIRFRGQGQNSPIDGDVRVNGTVNAIDGQMNLTIAGSLLRQMFGIPPGSYFDMEEFAFQRSKNGAEVYTKGNRLHCRKLVMNGSPKASELGLFSQLLDFPIDGGATAQALLLGEQVINKVKTRHFLLDTSVVKSLRGWEPLLGSFLAADMWISDDGYPIRIYAETQPDAKDQLGSVEVLGRTTLLIEFSKIGENIEISEPAVCRDAAIGSFDDIVAIAIGRGLKQVPAPTNLVRCGDNRLCPAPGYDWRSDKPTDYSVMWTPGKQHTSYQHVVAGNAEETWQPARGYRWLLPDDKVDLVTVPIIAQP